MPSRSQVKKAGKILRSAEKYTISDVTHAIGAVQEWRSQHNRSTEIVFEQLVHLCQNHPDTTVTFRLKRLSSIINKLRRSSNTYDVSSFDDLGGCRIVCSSIEQVQRIREEIVAHCVTGSTHWQLKEKDYIFNEELLQPSGYRSIHLLCSRIENEMSPYRVEIQIRTALEHLWATTVETMSLVYGYDYKSPIKSPESLPPVHRINYRFLQLLSVLFAYEEGLTTPLDLSRDAAVEELRGIVSDTQIRRDLQESGISYAAWVSVTIPEGLYLLTHDRELQATTVTAFDSNNLSRALEQYRQVEHTSLDDLTQMLHHTRTSIEPALNAVLIHTSSARKIRELYPNYFATNNAEMLTKLDSYLR